MSASAFPDLLAAPARGQNSLLPTNESPLGPGPWRPPERPTGLESLIRFSAAPTTPANNEFGLPHSTPTRRDSTNRRLFPKSRPRSHNSNHVHTLVVGGGMAGLTTASELQKAGVDVLVLEARDKIGGRIRSDEKTFSRPVNEGAEWCQACVDDDGKLSTLARNAQHKGAQLFPSNLTEGLYVNGHVGTRKEIEQFGTALDSVDAAIHGGAKNGEDIAVQDLLPKHNGRFGKLAEWVSLQLEYAAGARNISSEYLKGDTLNGNDLWTNQSKLLEVNVEDVPVLTSMPVTKIQTLPAGYEVTTLNGQTFFAEHVVVTVSTGVLAAKKIEFDPPLPQWKQDAIKANPMGNLEKVILEFDPAFKFKRKDGKTQPVDQVVFEQSNASAVPTEFLMRPGGSNLVIGFVGGSEARNLQAKSHPERVEYFMAKLRPIYGSGIDKHLSKSASTDWETDPYTLGSYSYTVPGKAYTQDELGERIGNLHFGGEATGGKKPIPGDEGLAPVQTMQAAQASGFRVSNEVLATIEEKRRQAPRSLHQETLGLRPAQ